MTTRRPSLSLLLLLIASFQLILLFACPKGCPNVAAVPVVDKEDPSLTSTTISNNPPSSASSSQTQVILESEDEKKEDEEEDDDEYDRFDESALFQRYFSSHPRLERVCSYPANVYRYCITDFPELHQELGYTNIYDCFADIDNMDPVDIHGARLQTLYFLLNGSASIRIPKTPIMTRLIQESKPYWSDLQLGALLNFAISCKSDFQTVWMAICNRPNLSLKKLSLGCSGSAIFHLGLTETPPSWEPIKFLMKGSAWIKTHRKLGNVNQIMFSNATVTSAQVLRAVEQGANIHAVRGIHNITFLNNDEGLDFLKKMVSYGLDVNFYRGPSYILEYAFRKDVTLEWFKTLLANGFNADGLATSAKESYLMLSMQAKREGIAHLLLTCGSDPNARANTERFSMSEVKGYTPLMLSHSVSITQRLIEKGADVNAQDDKGLTPLFYVGSYKSAKLLIDHGADVSQISHHKINLLMALSFSESLTTRLLDMNIFDVNAVDYEGQSALHYACNYDCPIGCPDSVNSIRRLLNAGADINLLDKRSMTPLMLLKQDLSIHWKTLMNAGFKPDIQDGHGNTLLHYAAKNQFTHIIKVLHKLNANPNTRNKRGLTPLDIGLREKKYEVIGLIVELFKNAEWTPTVVSTTTSSSSLTPVAAPTKSPKSPKPPGFLKVIFDGLKSAFNMPNANKAWLNSELPGMLDTLIQNGWSLDHLDNEGNSLLYLALRLGFPECVLQRGASKITKSFKTIPDYAESKGKTALMIASKHGYLDAVSKLLTAGADPNVQDKNGYTALMEAIVNDQAEVVDVLLGGGAKKEMMNKFGWDAMRIATSGRGERTEARMHIIESLGENSS